MIFCSFFTWIALGDVDWHFSNMLVRNTNGVEEETTWTMWLYKCNQSKHVTNGVTVMPLSASLLHEISVAIGCLWQIVLNQKLSHKVKKWHKCSSRIKAKLCKKKSHAMTDACERKSVNYAQCPEHSSGTHPNILNFGMRWRWTTIFISCRLYPQGQDWRLNGPWCHSECYGKQTSLWLCWKLNPEKSVKHPVTMLLPCLSYLGSHPT